MIIKTSWIKFKAWCLKNESVHCILLGASSVDQLYENIQSLNVILKFKKYYSLKLNKISNFNLKIRSYPS